MIKSSRLRLRWPRFRTRTLLTAITVLSLGLGAATLWRTAPIPVYEVTIQAPPTSGGPASAIDPPSQNEIMQAVIKADPTTPKLPTASHMLQQKVVDYVETMHVVPPAGRAELRHTQYMCKFYVSPDGSLKDHELRYVILVDHAHWHLHSAPQ